MPEHRIAIKIDLAIQRRQLAILGRDEGIDLQQRAVRLDKGAVQPSHKRDRLVDLRAFESQLERQLASLERLQTNYRLDIFLEDCVRILRRDFFNFHPARFRSHKHHLRRLAIHHDTEIKLAIDLRRFLNQQSLHFLPGRPRLVRHQRHAKNVFGVLRGLFQRLRHLHPAALAAPSGMNLSLDDNGHIAGTEKLFGSRIGLLQRGRHLACRHGNAILPEDLFRLVLVNFHRFQ